MPGNGTLSSTFGGVALLIGAGLLSFAPKAILAAEPGAIPVLTPDAGSLWVPDRAAGDDFLPPKSGPGPIVSDKEHLYNPLAQSQGQLTFRVADLNNPILQPWAKAQMQKVNDEVLAGKIPFTARERCWPGGVPGLDVYERDRPFYFLQTPKEVLIVTEYDQQVRRIRMNEAHSKNPKPSWYGESVGHYEGDTLVIDTVGLDGRTFVDAYRTPHSEKLHVIERWRLTDGGKGLEVRVTVEDPETYFQPWQGILRYRKTQEPFLEAACAENNLQFDYHMPVAEKPDF